MPTEIEKLIVSVESDVVDLVDGVEEGVDKAEKSLKDFEKTGKRAMDQAGKSAKGFGSILNSLKTGAAALVAVFTANKIVGFFKQIGGAAVATNAQFETFTTQFETLLGSTGAAQDRLEELAQFAQATPFEIPDIVVASRQLQIFGGTALATGDNLRMIGDIAAGVNQPFQDVAFWVGRMYDAIQNGQPFGEASARLQEMGALSGDTRRKLEEMQKAGADGAEIFAVFADEVGGRFTGNMERLSGTFQGVISNLIDFRENLIRSAGQEFFEGVRDDAKRFLDLISEEQMQEAIFGLAKALGDAAATGERLVASKIFEQLESVDAESLENLSMAVEDAAAALGEFSDREVSADLNGMIEALTVVIDLITTFTNWMNRAKEATAEARIIYDAVVEVLRGMVLPISNIIGGLGSLVDLYNQVTGEQIDFVDISRELAEASETQVQKANKQINVFDKLQAGVQAAADANRDMGDSADEAGEAIDKEAEKVKELLDKIAIDFIDATEDRNEKMAELEKALADELAEIDQEMADELVEINENFAEKRADILEDQADKLADLEENVADARAEAFKKAKEAEQKLEENTNEQLSDERQEFQREEKRETEDHLRGLQRLRLRFLDNLEDAVKSRDARAVRDLQRRFQREQAERSEDFETTQGRDREDQDLRLQEIREGNRQRAEEIQHNLDEELLKIEENERKKREKINEATQERLTDLDEQHQEQLMKLDERHQEELLKAQEDFDAKQMQLEEALQKRLEATAKALSDNEELQSDSAKKILETLNQTFGIGGDIDKLMEDFESRRNKRLTIRFDFEDTGRRGGGGRGSAAGRRRGGGGPPIPSFAEGGTLLASKPTLALFGEKGPEVAQFTPMGRLGSDTMAMNKKIDLDVLFRGSAPPGIRSGDRDQIAAVLVDALREAGLMRQ